ncbi:hypothetical protein AAU01_22780 [Paenarthrobacter aurescens]|uniref:Uncharacterized protein n=1 Tax=Paenarthrobacter aurescens TaxID=43663 RepID=A0A4Y3NE49_PAEAU|nr:hypothetical protein AAU01_22780 [Paenarthrobacter aurescens]
MGITGGSDAADGEKSVAVEGVMLSLLGAAEPGVLHEWFDKLADGDRIVAPLAPKRWGASEGQVVDRHGLRWLIGYEPVQKTTGRERPSPKTPRDVRDRRQKPHAT